MSEQSQRFRTDAFHVGPLRVVLEGPDREAIEGFEPLFSGFERSAAVGSAMPISITPVTDGDEPTQYQAHFNGGQVGSTGSQNHIALAVTRILNRAVLDAETKLLHLHAGAVHRDGVTVLVIGTSMAGKSTLVAKLVTQGWQYLSDEQLAVQPDGALVRFPRAITLRQRSWPLFDLDFPDVTSETDRIEVSPSLLGQVYPGEPVLPDVIIRPDVSVEHHRIEQLTTADALGVLIEDSLDLERAGDDGLNAMLAVTSAAPAYRVAGQDLALTMAAIDELCAAAVPPGAVIEEGQVDACERSDRVVGSRSWLFADRSSALYEPVTGALARLDEAGYWAWQQLAEAAERWPAEVASSEFVAALREAGLLVARR